MSEKYTRPSFISHTTEIQTKVIHSDKKDNQYDQLQKFLSGHCNNQAKLMNTVNDRILRGADVNQSPTDTDSKTSKPKATDTDSKTSKPRGITVPSVNLKDSPVVNNVNKLNTYFALSYAINTYKSDGNQDDKQYLNEIFENYCKGGNTEKVKEMLSERKFHENNNKLVEEINRCISDEKIQNHYANHYLNNIAQEHLRFKKSTNSGPTGQDDALIQNDETIELIDTIEKMGGNEFGHYQSLLSDPNDPKSDKVDTLVFNFSYLTYYLTFKGWGPESKELKGAYDLIIASEFVQPNQEYKVKASTSQRCEAICRATLTKGGFVDEIRIRGDLNHTTARMWQTVSYVMKKVRQDPQCKTVLDQNKQIFANISRIDKENPKKVDLNQGFFARKNTCKAGVEPTHLDKWLSTLTRDELKELYHSLSEKQRKGIDSYLKSHPDLSKHVGTGKNDCSLDDEEKIRIDEHDDIKSDNSFKLN